MISKNVLCFAWEQVRVMGTANMYFFCFQYYAVREHYRYVRDNPFAVKSLFFPPMLPFYKVRSFKKYV